MHTEGLLFDTIYCILGVSGQTADFGDVQSPFGYNAVVKGNRYWFCYFEDGLGNRSVEVIQPEEQAEFQLKWNLTSADYDNSIDFDETW